MGLCGARWGFVVLCGVLMGPYGSPRVSVPPAARRALNARPVPAAPQRIGQWRVR